MPSAHHIQAHTEEKWDRQITLHNYSEGKQTRTRRAQADPEPCHHASQRMPCWSPALSHQQVQVFARSENLQEKWAGDSWTGKKMKDRFHQSSQRRYGVRHSWNEENNIEAMVLKSPYLCGVQGPRTAVQELPPMRYSPLYRGLSG